MSLNINWQDLFVIVTTKLIALLLLVLAYIVIKSVVFKIIKASYQKVNSQFDQRAKTLYKVVESLTNYVLYFFTGYIALTILGVPVATLVAGAGIAGLTIGLGAQSFINDVVNGTFILLERQYDVGDFVIISNIEGRVKNIGLRLTTLIGVDGSVYYIRNKDIVIVNNLSKYDRRVVVNLFIKESIDNEVFTQLIEKATTQFLNTHPIVQNIKQLGFQTTPNGALYYSLAIFTSYANAVTLQNELYQHYIDALKQHNISLV